METDVQNIDDAIAALISGEAVIFPTDTVYGLGVAVEHAQTPEILYELKERDHGKPVAWLVSGLRALDTYGRAVPEFAYDLAKAFWPGQLTLIVKASAQVPDAYKAPGGTIALRAPDSEIAQALIARAGSPLATTSANISGQEAPMSFQQIDPVLLAKVPTALADSQEKSGIASTIIDCTGDHPVVVREGDISIADIQAHI